MDDRSWTKDFRLQSKSGTHATAMSISCFASKYSALPQVIPFDVCHRTSIKIVLSTLWLNIN
jgi:hypothetical protein